MADTAEIRKRLNLKRPAIAASVSDSEFAELTEPVLEAIDLIELRVDLFSDLSTEYVEKVFKRAKTFSKPLVATIRSFSEGGSKEIDDSQRLRLFELLVPLSSVVDVEIRSPLLTEVANLCKGTNCLLIGSFHDFSGTPERRELESIINKGYSTGADIIKIATTIEHDHHLRLLAELTLHQQSKGIVTVGMGQKGLLTRVAFPMLGSLFTFSAVGKPKAPGQIHVTELRSLINRLS